MSTLAVRKCLGVLFINARVPAALWPPAVEPCVVLKAATELETRAREERVRNRFM